MPYLERLNSPYRNEIRSLQKEKSQWLFLEKKGITRFRKLYDSVKHLRADFIDFSGDIVHIGKASDISDTDRQKVYEAMRGLMPWRKGPFNVFGIEIDAEWRSERKWKRVLPVLPDLKDKVVADIGCNNGYYMFRMAPYQPQWVIGFEPYLQHYFAFKTLNSFAGQKNLVAELIGVEHIALFEGCFDVVFLMGILYHRSSPVDVLKDIKKAMRPGASLIVESQAIPGENSVALFPEKCYAKVPGTFFVPTAVCLTNWLKRAGFKEIKIFCIHPMSSLEQRRTAWMTFESYSDFINESNPDLTVEGYPAPIRIYVKAKNRGKGD